MFDVLGAAIAAFFAIIKMKGLGMALYWAFQTIWLWVASFTMAHHPVTLFVFLFAAIGGVSVANSTGKGLYNTNRVMKGLLLAVSVPVMLIAGAGLFSKVFMLVAYMFSDTNHGGFFVSDMLTMTKEEAKEVTYAFARSGDRSAIDGSVSNLAIWSELLGKFYFLIPGIIPLVYSIFKVVKSGDMARMREADERYEAEVAAGNENAVKEDIPFSFSVGLIGGTVCLLIPLTIMLVCAVYPVGYLYELIPAWIISPDLATDFLANNPFWD